MPLEHTVEVVICKAPRSTYKHPQHTQKSRVLAQPRLWWRVQRWGATCDSRLAAQEPGTAHKQLLLPQGTLARPTRSGPGGHLRKAKDAD